MNIRKFLNQNAIYWAPASVDSYGNSTHGSPVDVKVRIVFTSSLRSTPISDSLVQNGDILSVTQLAPRGMIALGKVNDLPSDDSPAENGGIMIRTVLPYVDRRGVTLAYAITTESPFTMGVPV